MAPCCNTGMSGVEARYPRRSSAARQQITSANRTVSSQPDQAAVKEGHEATGKRNTLARQNAGRVSGVKAAGRPPLAGNSAAATTQQPMQPKRRRSARLGSLQRPAGPDRVSTPLSHRIENACMQGSRCMHAYAPLQEAHDFSLTQDVFDTGRPANLAAGPARRVPHCNIHGARRHQCLPPGAAAGVRSHPRSPAPAQQRMAGTTEL